MVATDDDIIEVEAEPDHLLFYEDDHPRIDCWCEPELVHVDGNSYLLHKDKNGHTILNDPKFLN